MRGITTWMQSVAACLMERYFAVCRAWMDVQLKRADEDRWFAMWYPSSLRQMA